MYYLFFFFMYYLICVPAMVSWSAEHVLVPFEPFFYYIDEIRSMHAQLWSAPTTSLKAWMDVVSLCSFLPIVSCLCVFLVSVLRPESRGFSGQLCHCFFSCFHIQRQEAGGQRKKKINGGLTHPLGTRALWIAKQGFPLRVVSSCCCHKEIAGGCGTSK